MKKKAIPRKSQYEALSSSLPLYIKSIELAFPIVVQKHKTEQYLEHARLSDSYAPEELDFLKKGLSEKLDGPVARAVQGSALVVLYGAFESTVWDFANDISGEVAVDHLQVRGGRESFLVQAERYFSDVLKIPLFSHARERDQLDILCRLRNSFVHRRSVIDDMPADLRKRVTHPTSWLVHGSIEGEFRIWVPSILCIHEHANLVMNWARSLMNRKFDVVGITEL